MNGDVKILLINSMFLKLYCWLSQLSVVSSKLVFTTESFKYDSLIHIFAMLINDSDSNIIGVFIFIFSSKSCL